MCCHVNIMSSPCCNSLLQPGFYGFHNKIYFIRRNHSKPNVSSHLDSSAEEQLGSEQRRLSLRDFKQPLLPRVITPLRKWESGLLMSRANPFAQNSGLNWKWGGEGHAISEFRHVYITAQDISQSRAKLLKFPGSRVAECWIEAQAFTFSSLLSLPLLCSGV